MFVAGATAKTAPEIIGVNRNTVRIFYQLLRQLHIASQLPSYELSGEVGADESYFGGVRKGKRGRGAAGKEVFEFLRTGWEGLHGHYLQAKNRNAFADHQREGSNPTVW